MSEHLEVIKNLNNNVGLFTNAMAKPELATALAIRAISLANQSDHDYIHGGFFGYSTAAVIRAIITDGSLSELPLNDSTVEGYVGLMDLLHTATLSIPSPDKILHYKQVNYTGRLVDGKYETLNLFVFHPSINKKLQSRLPTAHNSPTWSEKAHLVADEKPCIIHKGFIRGIDPDDTELLDFDEALELMRIPQEVKDEHLFPIRDAVLEEIKDLKEQAGQSGQIENEIPEGESNEG